MLRCQQIGSLGRTKKIRSGAETPGGKCVGYKGEEGRVEHGTETHHMDNRLRTLEVADRNAAESLCSVVGHRTERGRTVQ